MKFLHETLEDLISAMVFEVEFKTVTDNLDGTFTLGDVCKFHHAQPGYPVKIGGNDYSVVDYDYTTRILIVKGTNTVLVKSFNLDPPAFFHGTPLEQNAKLDKMGIDDKVPMIYLMEPYTQENDDSASSSIAYRATPTICFLTGANILKWVTDDFYHNCIAPMKNLEEDFVRAIKTSGLFYISQQKYNPKYYTKFGITLTKSGTKQLLFSENLSGIGQEMKFEKYAEDECCLSGEFNNDLDNSFDN